MFEVPDDSSSPPSIKNKLILGASDNSSDSDFYSDSDSGSLDNDSGSEKPEKPLKPGYERIYQECGWYHDRIIAKEGEERCGGCNVPYIPNDLCTDGTNDNVKYACNKCLEKGTIGRCKTCGTFVLKMDVGIKWLSSLLGGDHCKKCRPQKAFTFNIKDFRKSTGCIESETTTMKDAPIFKTIDITIPDDRISGLATNYFFVELAKLLEVNTNQVLIKGLWPNQMVCPGEFEPKDSIFTVMMIEKECMCNECDMCKHFSAPDYEYHDGIKFEGWLWPGMNQ